MLPIVHSSDTLDSSFAVAPQPEVHLAIRRRDEAEASLHETRTRVDDSQRAAQFTADTVERARRFLEEYWTRRDTGSSSHLEATMSAGLDLQLQTFARSVDNLVACLRDAIRDNARDDEAVNQLERRLRALDE